MRQVDEDEDDDRELPDESDLDDDDADETETIRCPHCGSDVYDQAQVCPKCGSYLSQEDSRPPRRPKWIVAGVIVCLLIVVFVWILR